MTRGEPEGPGCAKRGSGATRSVLLKVTEKRAFLVDDIEIIADN